MLEQQNIKVRLSDDDDIKLYIHILSHWAMKHMQLAVDAVFVGQKIGNNIQGRPN